MPNLRSARASGQPTGCDGLSVPSGCWNTICTAATSFAARRRTGRVATSCPSTRRLPLLAASRPASTFANVDLPEPDSPTIASTCPRLASSVSSSLATSRRRPTGKTRDRSCAAITVASSADQKFGSASGAGGGGGGSSAQRAQRTVWPGSAGSNCITAASQVPRSACAQRVRKPQVGGARPAAGTSPGIGTSGALRLSAPGRGSEASRPRV